MLRYALGIVYIWFGALKVAGVSQVAGLVRDTISFLHPPSWFVPALGSFEIGLGVWLIAGRALGFALPLFVAHMLGTFAVMVDQPKAAFQHGNPLELTMTGEFVVKNLVLLSAGLAVASWQVVDSHLRHSAPDREGVHLASRIAVLTSAGYQPVAARVGGDGHAAAHGTTSARHGDDAARRPRLR